VPIDLAVKGFSAPSAWSGGFGAPVAWS